LPKQIKELEVHENLDGSGRLTTRLIAAGLDVFEIAQLIMSAPTTIERLPAQR
jgi:hypothetical protein